MPYIFTLKNVNKIGVEVYEDLEKRSNLGDVIQDIQDRSYTFFDTYRNNVKLWICMYDHVTNDVLPKHTSIHCWWCRHSFTTAPLGIPLKYEGDRFEVEGVFCSFCCVKAYILDRRMNTPYKNSLTLLTLLYFKLYNELIDIPTSPTWQIINTYGGHLTIDQYRSTFGRLIYDASNVNTKRFCMVSIGKYIEERLL